MIPTRKRMLLGVARQVARELQHVQVTQRAPAPPRRGDRLVGAVAQGGLYLAVVAAVGAFFSAAFGHGTWQGWVRIGLGATLFGEGLLLFTNWRGARRLLVVRLQRRAEGPAPLLEALRRKLLGPALALAALAAFCGGLVLVALGVDDLL